MPEVYFKNRNGISDDVKKNKLTDDIFKFEGIFRVGPLISHVCVTLTHAHSISEMLAVR